MSRSSRNQCVYLLRDDRLGTTTASVLALLDARKLPEPTPEPRTPDQH